MAETKAENVHVERREGAPVRKVHPHDLEEPMLLPEPGRSPYVMHPVRHWDLYELSELAEESFWTSGEIDLEDDVIQMDEMKEDKPGLWRMIMMVLAFFAASDGIVNENLGDRFSKEVTWPEARYFYGIQTGIETIHSKIYSALITAFVPDHEEQERLFNAVEHFESIGRKARWALNYAQSDASFGERKFAFMLVEGLFFSASFAIIFYLKTLGILPGTCFSNELISRDEGLHTAFAILELNTHIKHRPTTERAHAMVVEAVDAECAFVDDCLPEDLLGMNRDLMKSYVRYTANRLLLRSRYPPLFGEKEGQIDAECHQPFGFMDNIATETKANFFERRVAQYRRKVLRVGGRGWVRPTKAKDGGAGEAPGRIKSSEGFTLDADF